MEVKMTTIGRIGVTALLVAMAADAARAQVIGTFSWTTLPYCNVVTVTVVQQGPLYQLTGSDNLCGAGPAPVTGTAVPGGAGVVFGMTAAYPSGRAANLSASISLASLSGTWADADGNTGTFSFGAVAGGAARPSPVAATAITVNQFAASIYAGTGSASTVARSDHTHDDRYYTKAEVLTFARPLAAFGDNIGTVSIGTAVAGTVVAAATIAVPTAGVLVASGSTSLTESNEGEVGCGLRTDTTYDNPTSSFYQPSVGALRNSTTTVVRHFVVAAGNHTISLICRSFASGASGSRNGVSLVFVPQ
jgi:hypothetical protein